MSKSVQKKHEVSTHTYATINFLVGSSFQTTQPFQFIKIHQINSDRPHLSFTLTAFYRNVYQVISIIQTKPQQKKIQFSS